MAKTRTRKRAEGPQKDGYDFDDMPQVPSGAYPTAKLRVLDAVPYDHPEIDKMVCLVSEGTYTLCGMMKDLSVAALLRVDNISYEVEKSTSLVYIHSAFSLAKSKLAAGIPTNRIRKQ